MDRSRELVQDASNTTGTVARINPDGNIPDHNPFVDDPDKADAIQSRGHRYIQAADLHPQTGELWTIERVPAGGNEFNNPKAADSGSGRAYTRASDVRARRTADSPTGLIIPKQKGRPEISGRPISVARPGSHATVPFSNRDQSAAISTVTRSRYLPAGSSLSPSTLTVRS
jgi:hypothetical protein